MKKYKFVAVMLGLLLIYVFSNHRMQLEQVYSLFVDEVGRIAGRSILPYSVYIEDAAEETNSAEKGIVSGVIKRVYPFTEIMKSEFNNLENAKNTLQKLERETAEQTAGSRNGSTIQGEEVQGEKASGEIQPSKNQNEQQEITERIAAQNNESQNNQNQNNQPQSNGNQSNGNPNNGNQNTNGASTEVISHNLISGTVYPKANLSDYNFVYSNFYTVTSITKLSSAMLRPAEFLEKDMRISHDASTPQILIFHTHSQEEFVDSVAGDPATTIVGVGDYLTKLLQEKYGYSVIHDKGVYDLVDGKLDRSKA